MNSMVTYGGKAPVERVSGRPPRGVVTMESSSPDQLTTPDTARDLADRTLHKLAMKSYLEARQRAELRTDIAARPLPSEGPFFLRLATECITGK